LTVEVDRDISYWWEFSHIALLLDYVFSKNINTILEGNYCPLLFRSLIFYATNFFVSIIPMGIIISWICMKNRKSVLAAIVFHFIINISSEMLNISQITKCIETIVLTLIGAALVMLEKEMFFSKAHLVSEAN
jgi:uncharacterized protein